VQSVGSHMRFRVVKDFLRRTAADKFLQNIPDMRILRSRVELSVGEGSGAAFPKLNVGGSLKLAGFPEPLHIPGAFLHRFSAFQNQRHLPCACEHQRGKKPRRPAADNHRPVCRGGGFFHRISIRLHNGRVVRKHRQIVIEADIQRRGEADVVFMPRVDRPAIEHCAAQLLPPNFQRGTSAVFQILLPVIQRQRNILNPYHSLFTPSRPRARPKYRCSTPIADYTRRRCRPRSEPRRRQKGREPFWIPSSRRKIRLFRFLPPSPAPAQSRKLLSLESASLPAAPQAAPDRGRSATRRFFRSACPPRSAAAQNRSSCEAARQKTVRPAALPKARADAAAEKDFLRGKAPSAQAKAPASGTGLR